MDDKNLIDVMNKMSDIIDILPKLEEECPDVRDTAIYQKMCQMRNDLMDYMEKYTREINQNVDTILGHALDAGNFSKDN